MNKSFKTKYSLRVCTLYIPTPTIMELNPCFEKTLLSDPPPMETKDVSVPKLL